MQAEDCTHNLSQAIRLKKLSQTNALDTDQILSILNEEKANQKEQISFPVDKIKGYFPPSYTPQQMEQTILKLLEQLERKRRREIER